MAFQALYCWEVQKLPVVETLLDFSWLEPEQQTLLDEETRMFSRLLITGTVENITDVDAMIKTHLENWDFSRISRVDLALLRISAYALMYQKDVPVAIVISDAVVISQRFGDSDSYRFINGVLDAIHKTLQASVI